MGFNPREIWATPCVVCLKPFWPYRSDRIYCGPACKQLAYNERKRAAAAAEGYAEARRRAGGGGKAEQLDQT